jgi:transcriptional regulator PpsR
VNRFSAPKQFLAGLDAETAAALVATASDIALILDSSGIIRDISISSEDLPHEDFRKWVGQAWVQTVTLDSRPKVESLLKDAAARTPGKWRHVNHTSPRGADIPLLYSAVQVGKEGRIVVFGRDLRALAALQQRLVEAQQSMQRDYLRLRHMETRYRLLFEQSTDAVLVVDGNTLRVSEANQAAANLMGDTVKRIVGKPFFDWFEGGSVVVQGVLDDARASGRVEQVSVSIRGQGRNVMLSVSLFRQEGGVVFLMRLGLQQTTAALGTGDAGGRAMLLKLMESAPDAFVVTDPGGKILVSNAAFIELVEAPSRDQVVGQSLERWLGRSGVDLSVLLSNLKQHGSVHLFATTLRGQHGTSASVEISATSALGGETPCLGFVIRDVGRRLSADPRSDRALPQSVSELTELVGRVPLKDIVGETTDLIEQMCIEAALQLTGDNRASAAEMLGLSRQSLYVKLRRYGLGDLGSDDK